MVVKENELFYKGRVSVLKSSLSSVCHKRGLAMDDCARFREVVEV